MVQNRVLQIVFSINSNLNSFWLLLMWDKYQVFLDWQFGDMHVKAFLSSQFLVFDLPFTADHLCIRVISSSSPFHINPK